MAHPASWPKRINSIVCAVSLHHVSIPCEAPPVEIRYWLNSIEPIAPIAPIAEPLRGAFEQPNPDNVFIEYTLCYYCPDDSDAEKSSAPRCEFCKMHFSDATSGPESKSLQTAKHSINFSELRSSLF